MGGALACLKEEGGVEAPDGVRDLAENNPITEDVTQKMADVTDGWSNNVMETYSDERRYVEWHMWWESPEPWTDEENKVTLTWEKSAPGDVHALVMKRVCGTEARDRMTDQINDECGPTIDSNIAKMPDPAQPPARSTADKAIEKAVDKTIGAMTDRLNEQFQKNPELFRVDPPQEDSEEAPPRNKRFHKK